MNTNNTGGRAGKAVRCFDTLVKGCPLRQESSHLSGRAREEAMLERSAAVMDLISAGIFEDVKLIHTTYYSEPDSALTVFGFPVAVQDLEGVWRIYHKDGDARIWAHHVERISEKQSDLGVLRVDYDHEHDRIELSVEGYPKKKDAEALAMLREELMKIDNVLSRTQGGQLAES